MQTSAINKNASLIYIFQYQIADGSNLNIRIK